MKFLVYKISNSINNKIYFGVTQQSLKKRWQQHKCNSSRKNYHLYNAINKYGFENFKIEVVFEAKNKKEMFDKEIELIKKYKSNQPEFGYNNSSGGESSRFGCKLTDDQKKKISEYQKSRIRGNHTHETKFKMSQSAKGRDMTVQIESSAEKRRGKPSHNSLKIVLNGNTVFNSITEASIKTGICIGAIHNNLKGLSKKNKSWIMGNIKGQDLRIGNLYESTDGRGFVKVDVTDLMAWEMGAVFGKPIPLTEELFDRIIKNQDEWHYNGFGTRIIYQHVVFKSISIELTGDSRVVVYFNGELINIKDHVHQLQNLYYALTGEELIFE